MTVKRFIAKLCGWANRLAQGPVQQTSQDATVPANKRGTEDGRLDAIFSFFHFQTRQPSQIVQPGNAFLSSFTPSSVTPLVR